MWGIESPAIPQNKYMAKDVQKIIAVRPAYQVIRGAVKQESTLHTQYGAVAIFDTAGIDSAGLSNSAIGAHGTGVFIPTKSIVVRAFYQVVTGFTSAGGNTGTVAISIQ